MHKTQFSPVAFLAGFAVCLLAAPSFAGDFHAGVSGKGRAGTLTTESSSSGCPQNADGTFCWMSPDIGEAWASGYTGSGVSVTVVDDFTGEMEELGDLGHGPQWRQHGQWIAQAAGMVAPGAKIIELDYSEPVPLTLEDGLNVINLSYALEEPVSGYQLEQSIVDAARAGAAVFTKGAGNESVAVGTPTEGNIDFLALELTGTQSTIFVGALEHNGTPENKAKLASYSNYAGSDSEVQNHFLTVGVDSDKIGLSGTSVAAPVVAGYAAIVGSKFTSATPTQITNQLLDTARTDTLVNYDPAIYGRGEPSLSRALAPVSIR
ncbi:Peptidase_S8 domain-containing protein [Mesorhizobium ventifaucium]|uniref:Peptidase_S8 domain-containing protein n=2 Tax=Mesorhizobium ventifaucium TaxID=666020 RepID=A0ABN8KB53_9HYPH|nr:Peptidase_S8 domain-containing protein [Mesorhizobium ventifaucium]